MKRIESEIIIEANASEVWSVLLDFEHYEKWNPFITSISGNPVVGSKLKVALGPPGSGGMKFEPVVSRADVNQEFRWWSCPH